MSQPPETTSPEQPSETTSPEKPRRRTQFKPGQSGNLLGRPKNRKMDISTALNKALNDNIRVTGFGKTKTGSEAYVQTIVDRVLQGDLTGIPALMALFKKTKLFNPVPNPTRLSGVVMMPPDYLRDSRLGMNKVITTSETARDFM